MELWEKTSWVLKNCKFASNVAQSEVVIATNVAAFRVACHRAKVQDEESLMKVAKLFLEAIVHDITNPAVNTVNDPIQQALESIKPQVAQEFQKMKSMKGKQVLMSADLPRIAAVAFRQLLEILQSKGIPVTNKQNIRVIVDNVVNQMNGQQRDISVSVPKKDEFMGDRKTNNLNDLATKEIGRLNMSPKFPAKPMGRPI